MAEGVDRSTNLLNGEAVAEAVSKLILENIP